MSCLFYTSLLLLSSNNAGLADGDKYFFDEKNPESTDWVGFKASFLTWWSHAKSACHAHICPQSMMMKVNVDAVIYGTRGFD